MGPVKFIYGHVRLHLLMRQVPWNIYDYADCTTMTVYHNRRPRRHRTRQVPLRDVYHYFHYRRENVYFRYGRVQLLPTTSRERLLPLHCSKNARFKGITPR